MQCVWCKLLGIGATIFMVITFLYLGHCTGAFGRGNKLLKYVFQCSCPRALENARVQQLYSEHAEILFSACDNIDPIPSPSGQKIAVINYDKLDQSYIWILQTDEKIPFTLFERGDLFWITEDFLFVSWGGVAESVFDLGTKVDSPITLRKGLRLSNGQDAWRFCQPIETRTRNTLSLQTSILIFYHQMVNFSTGNRFAKFRQMVST